MFLFVNRGLWKNAVAGRLVARIGNEGGVVALLGTFPTSPEQPRATWCLTLQSLGGQNANPPLDCSHHPRIVGGKRTGPGRDHLSVVRPVWGRGHRREELRLFDSRAVPGGAQRQWRHLPGKSDVSTDTGALFRPAQAAAMRIS